MDFATKILTMSSGCSHECLILSPSKHASAVGYHHPTSHQRQAAATTSTSNSKLPLAPSSGSFPSPLVLPGDDLAIDPSYPAQSLRSWVREKERNPVTEERKTIYVVRPPNVDLSGVANDGFAEMVRGWSEPQLGEWKGTVPKGSTSMNKPSIGDVVEYLTAFFHGMEVKLLPERKELKFAPWEDETDSHLRKSKSKTKTKTKPQFSTAPKFIGLQTTTEAIGIRVRPSPPTFEFEEEGVEVEVAPPYSHQLNLDDLLDVTISILPSDAYALLMLVEHDLFEDEEDVFVCGRAYGGSRVAVVSWARYDPRLDQINMEINTSSRDGYECAWDREHVWPATHCKAYVEKKCANEPETQPPRKKKKNEKHDDVPEASIDLPFQSYYDFHAPSSFSNHPPLPAALLAYTSFPQAAQPSSPSSSRVHSLLHLFRTLRTASHELCHCFGIDHCIYYSCNMQGSSSIAEDARQSPFMCPIDLQKLMRAAGQFWNEHPKAKKNRKAPNVGNDDQEWVKTRYTRMRQVCDKWKDEGREFCAMTAWIDSRQRELGGIEEGCPKRVGRNVES